VLSTQTLKLSETVIDFLFIIVVFVLHRPPLCACVERLVVTDVDRLEDRSEFLVVIVGFLAPHRAFSGRVCVVVIDLVGGREFGDGIAMALVREVAARRMKIGDIVYSSLAL
jgi:hypothetical protein